ncbi:TPR-like protein [Auriculariales sp. MPI-PUGE-AT-0066]|nr:TPR-like protein [Auriculariales sp. MPI-PUGE-AT-0066]
MSAPNSLRAAEWSLITSTWDDSNSDTADVVALASDCVRGEYAQVLLSPSVTKLLKGKTWAIGDAVGDLFEFEETSTQEQELLRLVVVTALIHAFLQTNWTGPDFVSKPTSVLGLDASVEDALNTQAIAELSYRGEPAYHLAQQAVFLRIAQLLMDLPYSHSATATWWSMRVATIHQYMLDEPAALSADVTDAFDKFRSTLTHDHDLLGRFILERGLIHHHFGQDKIAAEHFVEASRKTGLQYELTGALGKRTKFQQNALSQLVLLAESRTESTTPATAIPTTLNLNDDTLLEHTQFTVSSSAGSGALAHIDPGNQTVLHPLDQCILLALCLNVRNTSPSHGLTQEQMAPYVTRVLENPRNWSIHTMGLLLRARLEAGRTRTVERSVMQLQALVDQLKVAPDENNVLQKPADAAPVSERLAFVHDIPLPSRWALERELGLRLLELGVVKSALDIFTRLEMWEEVVRCYAMLESTDKAVAIVRDLLSGARTESDAVVKIARGRLDKAREAKLWCLLGDLEPASAEQHYLHAWELSRQTSGRAARALGGLYFNKAEYAKAVPFLEAGARINPLIARTWFLLGCAEMRRERWREARDAFAMCVSVDDEDSESWNNLASVYLRLDATAMDADESSAVTPSSAGDDIDASSTTKRETQYANRLAAFRALREGLKHAYQNWRMWSNYAIIALDVGELHECVRAVTRVVEERAEKVGAEAVDIDIVERLVAAVTRESAAANLGVSGETGVAAADGLDAIPEDAAADEGKPAIPRAGTLNARVTDLFERVILPRVSSPRIFKSYAQLKSADGAWAEALKAHMDAYRATSSASGSLDTVETWRAALSDVEDAVDVLRNFGPKAEGEGSKWKVQARGLVRTFVGRSKDFADEPEWTRVQTLQDELKRSSD